MRRIVFQLVAAGAVLLAYHVRGIDLVPDVPAHGQDHAACVSTGTTCIALNQDVTTETIAGTICTPGYTAHVRPASSYTEGIKSKLGHEVGVAPNVAEAMVLDHIIPLCLGGHPRDPSNLQLQDVAESHRKDRIEIKLQCLVCTGQVSLEEARAAIATDWRVAYHRFAAVKCRRPNRVRVTERGEAPGTD